MMIRPILIGTAYILISFAVIYRLYPYFEPQRIFYDTHGIGVSHHQGDIDWHAVAGDGVSFVFMKATEGGDFVDPKFQKNWKAAAEAGIPRGAYHFFTKCRSGAEQAANFIRTVPKDPNALPPVIEAEHMGVCNILPEVESVPHEITQFMEIVQAHYEQRPIIYTTQEFHETYLKYWSKEHVWWVRSLLFPPRFRMEEWQIWQYHNAGRRDGIHGPVDLNIWRHKIPPP